VSDLDSVLTALVKKWGEGTVVDLEDIANRHYEGLSSGVLALDLASGIGGYPRGAVTTLFGPAGGGKTTLCLWFLASLRQTGRQGVYVDMEHKTPGAYIADIFRGAGADANNLPILKPSTGVEALDAVEKLVGKVDAIVLDSIASLVPPAEIDGDMGDVHVGLQARMISQALRRIGPKLDLSDTVLLCTNQVRANIGGYGNPETTPGGKYLFHQEVLRFRISRFQDLTDRGAKIGIVCKAKVRKNQAASPTGEASFDIIWNKGVDVIRDTFEVAKALEILEQRGPYYYYDWDNDGNVEDGIRGQVGVMQRFREDLDLMERIRTEALATIIPVQLELPLEA
jgi:recombination protein RecA